MENIYTEDDLYEDFCRLGVKPGSALELHSSLSAIGYVVGGAVAVIAALRRALGKQGTLIAPAHTAELTDPEIWSSPPVGRQHWERIRKSMPLFDPQIMLPTTMGIIPCTLLAYPKARRSLHPIASFVALGKEAEYITADHSLHEPEGWQSPVGKLYQLDGWVLLLGVDNRRNTSLHLAEIAADAPYIEPMPGKPNDRVKIKDTKGRTRFVTLARSAQCSEGFIQAEPHLRKAGITIHGKVGDAACQLMRQRPAVNLITKLLKEDPAALLCDESDCRQCAIFRERHQS
jgi:aminoglycoside 3-N-acetyltransferase